jgi:hypothetical protein
MTFRTLDRDRACNVGVAEYCSSFPFGSAKKPFRVLKLPNLIPLVDRTVNVRVLVSQPFASAGERDLWRARR